MTGVPQKEFVSASPGLPREEARPADVLATSRREL